MMKICIKTLQKDAYLSYKINLNNYISNYSIQKSTVENVLLKLAVYRKIILHF